MRSLSVVNKKVDKSELLKLPDLPEGVGERPYTFVEDRSTEAGRIEADVVAAFEDIYDPEIPVDIFALGLIYGIDVDADKNVHVTMTLTAPNCPVAQSMPEDIRLKAAGVEGVSSATIEVTWDPPWNRGMMTEEAKLDLNL